MASFGLKDFSSFGIMDATDPNKKAQDVVSMELSKLKHYNYHPFKLYDCERLNEMAESIKIHGVLFPILIRPIENGFYEILAGHNRFEASKLAELSSIPSIIKENLTDEEAHIIVTESNLLQRSFTDMSHSERAEVIKVHFEATKKQGKRNDLVNEIENIVNTFSNSENTSHLEQEKQDSREKLAEELSTSRGNVARYLRIYELIKPFKELLDENQLSIRAGVSISYLRKEEQNTLYQYTDDNEVKIDMKKAELLRELSKNGRFSVSEIEKIFVGKAKPKPKKSNKVLKINRTKIQSFFNETDTEANIEETIVTALKYYFENREG